MVVLLFVSLSLLHLCQSCSDIDPGACQIMAQKQPELCSDDAIAQTACPKFCKLCPVECYHCNATLNDYHMCNNTMMCRKGQICMIKELKSIYDGHHEYEMTCADKQQCDSPWLGVSAFGKRRGVGSRGIEARDLSVTCCAHDLCNYPEASTTQPTATHSATTQTVPHFTLNNGCVRDLIIIVDESTSLARYEGDIKGFLKNVVSQLPVSSSEVHVSLGMFAATSRTVFDLDDILQKDAVLTAIDRASFHGGSGDTNEALKYVLNAATSASGGNRAGVPDVVIIITDDGASNSLELNHREAQLRQTIHNVIAIEIGNVRYSNLASDRQHNFELANPRDLAIIERQVVSLIC